MRHKVLAFITRHPPTQRQVLVFAHRDYPQAGLQVPAGTVEDAEPIDRALWREIHEESGLQAAQLRLVRQLTEFPETGGRRYWHLYQLEAVTALPDQWLHTVQGKGADQGLVFRYYWINLADAPRLITRMGHWAALIDPSEKAG
jgi:8-oxo-dGTP pyrophosphatase MutT (NUDIX family)